MNEACSKPLESLSRLVVVQVPSCCGSSSHTPLFMAMLTFMVVVVSALTYIPALALGPLAEHLQFVGGAK